MSRPPSTPPAPGPGQESVWDYPRPPRLERTGERVTIILGGVLVADTTRPVRILETSHPPTYYLPRDDFAPGSLRATAGSSFCEWKGMASYVDVVAGDVVARAAGWYYVHPTAAFTALTDMVAVYPGAMEACTVDGERVRAQAGDFYGGWITARVIGPFKGEPGTQFW